MGDGSPVTQIGDRVRFAVADVFLPGTGPGFPEPPELDGTVVEFSDSGDRKRAFALVEVVKRQLMVVPVEKLQKMAGLSGGSMEERPR